MDLKVIHINSKDLDNVLQKFVAVWSLVHKSTPDELTIIANFDGNYPNEEEKKVTIVDGKEFFDAVVYLGMEVERRPKPIDIRFEKAKNGSIEILKYDDMAYLTTYIFNAFFFIVIRAHPPSDSGVYANQPMPNFIRNIMNCKASISEISDYVSAFDLIKLSPEWVIYIPTKCISQEAVNRLGLSVSGYRLVSVVNVIAPDLYLEEGDKDTGRSNLSKDKEKSNDSDGKKRRYKIDYSEPYKYQMKPKYLDIAVAVIRSFKKAGYCWDFHPVTISPDVMRLLANGTKFFDALVYLSMEEEIRPKPIFLEFEKAADGTIEIPTYDDMSKLTTFIFVAYFFVVIRAHAPSDNGIYANQPIPNFIANIMNCKSTVTEVSDYISSFDLIKLSPEWVKFIPTTSISQESVNRLGLGVAGYRLVSVFNVIAPDMYTDKTAKDEEYKYATKPAYLDVAVSVMRSFRQAGYCWNFHPATRSPDIMSTYGNINKNAGNLILECYTKKTLEKLKSIKKLSVIPQFDPAHTEYRTWTLEMKYKASHRINIC
ncbi:hypothetical protein OnM2_036073 [Erysiphe neolycopersici]|uniref:Uncharacterized protein n=1 Tax=Erysiphe neolycopersici TaxID=212602 RepID=A0A420HXC5_9PEZI|nr:hypothetical protein OnM2_036073 [Erysiphe neolycopersici]